MKASDLPKAGISQVPHLTRQKSAVLLLPVEVGGTKHGAARTKHGGNGGEPTRKGSYVLLGLGSHVKDARTLAVPSPSISDSVCSPVPLRQDQPISRPALKQREIAFDGVVVADVFDNRMALCLWLEKWPSCS